MHMQSGRWVVVVAVVAALLAAVVGYVGRPGLDVASAQAAAGPGAVYMLSLPAVQGSSTLKGYEQQIEVMSWSWGATAQTAGPRGAGRAVPQPLVVSKRCDVASVPLWTACGSGKLFPSATFYVLAASGAQHRVALEIKLTNVSVANCNVNGQDSAGACEEQIAFSYSKVEWTYPTQNTTGGPGQPIKGSWDVGGVGGRLGG